MHFVQLSHALCGFDVAPKVQQLHKFMDPSVCTCVHLRIEEHKPICTLCNWLMHFVALMLHKKCNNCTN
jgi:hypothetical protein